MGRSSVSSSKKVRRNLVGSGQVGESTRPDGRAFQVPDDHTRSLEVHGFGAGLEVADQFDRSIGAEHRHFGGFASIPVQGAPLDSQSRRGRGLLESADGGRAAGHEGVGDLEIVEEDLVVGGGREVVRVPPVEGREVELVDVHGVAVAEAEAAAVHGELAVEPGLDASIGLTGPGGGGSVQAHLCDQLVPDAGGHTEGLARGILEDQVGAVGAALAGVVEVEGELGVAAPHDARRPAVGPRGDIAPGVALRAAQAWQLASLDPLEPLREEHAVAQHQCVAGAPDVRSPLGAAGQGSPRAGRPQACGRIEDAQGPTRPGGVPTFDDPHPAVGAEAVVPGHPGKGRLAGREGIVSHGNGVEVRPEHLRPHGQFGHRQP